MRDDIQIKFSRIKNWKNKEEEDEDSSWKTIDNTWKIERIILIALIPVSLLRITWLVILLSVLELLCITRFIRIEQRYFDWDHATKYIFGDKENKEDDKQSSSYSEANYTSTE